MRALTVTPARGLADVSVADIVKSDTMAGVRRAYKAWRSVGGPQHGAQLFTPPTHQPKAVKASRAEYVLHLAPERLADVGNACPWSTRGCRKACLNTAGRGTMSTVQRGRIARTRFMHDDPAGFALLLSRELGRIARRHGFDDLRPMVRLNGTSDIAWERIPVVRAMMVGHADRLTFADYTKATLAQRPAPDLPNYKLARSVWRDRETVADIVALWAAGEHVSVVAYNRHYALGAYRAPWATPFADASATDEWLLDPTPRIGLLEPLGRADVVQDAYDARELMDAMRDAVAS